MVEYIGMMHTVFLWPSREISTAEFAQRVLWYSLNPLHTTWFSVGIGSPAILKVYETKHETLAEQVADIAKQCKCKRWTIREGWPTEQWQHSGEIVASAESRPDCTHDEPASSRPHDGT
jgi:hypothetical protein